MIAKCILFLYNQHLLTLDWIEMKFIIAYVNLLMNILGMGRSCDRDATYRTRLAAIIVNTLYKSYDTNRTDNDLDTIVAGDGNALCKMIWNRIRSLRFKLLVPKDDAMALFDVLCTFHRNIAHLYTFAFVVTHDVRSDAADDIDDLADDVVDAIDPAIDSLRSMFGLITSRLVGYDDSDNDSDNSDDDSDSGSDMYSLIDGMLDTFKDQLASSIAASLGPRICGDPTTTATTTVLLRTNKPVATARKYVAKQLNTVVANVRLVDVDQIDTANVTNMVAIDMNINLSFPGKNPSKSRSTSRSTTRSTRSGPSSRYYRR